MNVLSLRYRLRFLIRRKATEAIAKFAVKLIEMVDSDEIPDCVQKVAPDFVRVTSAPAASRRAPWILPPIFENGKFVYRSYFPSKGELATLYKGKKQDDRADPESLADSDSPWLMLPPSFDGMRMVYKFYSLCGEGRSLNLKSRGGYEEAQLMRDGDAKLVGSSHGWLASTSSIRDFFLFNPLSGRLIELPKCGAPLKVIVSCSPEEDECRALMSFGYRRLAFCCPGKSKDWTLVGDPYKDHHGMKLVRGYDDIVYSASRKLFFAVLEDEPTVEAWDLADPNSPRLVWKETLQLSDENEDDNDDDDELTAKDWCRPVRYLVSVDSSDQLFLVTRHIMDSSDAWNIEDTKTIDFDVHRIESIDHDGGRRGIKLSSLDGLAMFVGINHSFALPASELTGLLKPDCIYFTHGKDGYDLGVFDYKNKTCTFQLQYSSMIRPSPLWFTPHPT